LDQEQEHIMPAYQVTFFKHLVDSSGHPFHCPQQCITIVGHDADEALRAAEAEFRRTRNTRHWTTHADDVEVQLVNEPSAPSRTKRRA
jgi:hypothetical protein